MVLLLSVILVLLGVVVTASIVIWCINMEEDPLLTLSEVGKRTGVSHTTVRKWIDSGVLIAIQMPQSSRQRVRESDLLDFLSQLTENTETSETSETSRDTPTDNGNMVD